MTISRIIRIISSSGRRPAASVLGVAIATACACALLATGAEASAWKSPHAALKAANRALDQSGTSWAERGSDSDPTLALRNLHAVLPRLHGDRRRQALRLLARPTDAKDPYHNSYKVPEAAPYCTANFCVHYVTTTADAPDLTDLGGVLGVPDYVEKIDVAAETSYAVENVQLGWPAPRSDGTLGGGDGLTDIYLVNVGGDGLFGYSAPDPSQNCKRKCFAFLVMDNDFSFNEFGYENPQIPLEVTIAHEYNHVLQFGIDAALDGWLFESSATWSEDKVFPNDNDYVNYLNTFARTPGVPITKFSGGRGLRIYGLAVLNHYLDSGAGGLGPGVVLGAWKAGSTTDPANFALGALNESIRNLGGLGFGQEFTKFAAATAEWRTSGGFPDATSYPDVKREGALLPDTGTTKATLDHTAYRLYDVSANAASSLTLSLNSGSVRAGIALVGHDNDDGTVTTAVRYLGHGGKASVTLIDPTRYERITAVVVNADTRISGRARDGRDWHYIHDNAPLKIKLK
jgi:hypothetical protein